MPRRDAPLVVPLVDWHDVMDRACTRKTPYTSRRDAFDARKHLVARTGDHTIRVYRCAFDSSHHHLGHAPDLAGLRRIAAALRARAADPAA